MHKKEIIVFKLLPEKGHHYASLYLAEMLKLKGYTVFYAAEKEMEAVIVNNGFEYYEIKRETVSGTLINKPVSKIRMGISSVRSQIKNLKKTLLESDPYSRIIKDLNPAALIIDRSLSNYTMQAYAFGIPVFVLETTVSTAKFKRIPSLNSYHVPSDTLLSALLADLSWRKYLATEKLDRFLFGGLHGTMLKIAAKSNYAVENIDFNRYQSPGYRDIPELIVSPEEFDFPHTKNNNQFYIGPSLFSNRTETGCDPDYHDRMAKIKGKPLVYCAMGTMPWRYPGINNFFSALVDAFALKTEWNLVLCVDDDIVRRKIRQKNIQNVHIFNRVPQKELLGKVDVMINHGGMNSITECILSLVPMLIYPGTSTLDQVGNSSRVVYHGLGLRGKLTSVKSSSIAEKIQILLENGQFKESLKAMKERIMSNKNSEKGADIISSIIQSRKARTNNQPQNKTLVSIDN